MERFLGVEEARGKLGQLVADVAASGEPVVLTRCGRVLAVLLSREEYARFKRAETAAARAELERYLLEVRKKVRAGRLKRNVVDEAIGAIRRAR